MKYLLIVHVCICILPGLFESKSFASTIREVRQQETSNIHHSLVGAFVFPHGGITLDPEILDFSQLPATGVNTQAESIKLHKAMLKNAADLVNTRPDLIILSTPHGLELQDNFLLIGNPVAEGKTGTGNNFTAEFIIDTDITKSLYKHLKALRHPVDVLYLGIGQDTMPLLWAEVIPWWFLQQAASQANFQLPPVLYIGQPAHRNISKLLKIGEDISTWLQTENELQSRRVAVVISCDLSHYHSSSPTSPYPYNKAAPIFDSHCVHWAKLDALTETELKSSNLLVKEAGALIDSAGSCGYTGLLMLHGIMRNQVKQGVRLKANFYEYSVPSYFGMMVNNWQPYS